MTAKFLEFEKSICSLISSKETCVIFEDYQIELVQNGNPLPQYFLETKDENYLLISKIKHNKKCSSNISPLANSSQNAMLEMSMVIEGSPLKLKDIQAEYSSLSPIYSSVNYGLQFYETYKNWLKDRGPISTSQCRRLLSMFNEISTNIFLELWALSGGNDDPTVFMSSQMIKGEKIVNVQRVVEYLDTIDSLANSFDFSKLLTDPYKNIMNMQCKARYMLFGLKFNNCMSHDPNSYIEAEMSWTTEFIRVEKPPYTATTVLNINIGNSKKDSHTFAIFLELQFLKELVNGYYNGFENCEFNFDESKVKKNWIADVENLFDEYEMGGTNVPKNDEAIFDSGFLNFKTRDDLDFTENLWQTLKGCIDVTAITECIHLVLQNIKNNTFQPVVTNENWTGLGDFIRSSFSNKISKYQIAEFVNDLKPLELFIEIGMYKIMRDYLLILFGENVLLPVKYFDFFFKNFKNDSIKLRFDKLIKLNMVIELVYILQINKRLPDHTLEHVISVVIKNFEKKKLEDCYLQNINIPTITIATGLDLSEVYFCSYNMKGDHEQTNLICTNYFPYQHIPCQINVNQENVLNKFFHVSVIKQYEEYYKYI